MTFVDTIKELIFKKLQKKIQKFWKLKKRIIQKSLRCIKIDCHYQIVGKELSNYGSSSKARSGQLHLTRSWYFKGLGPSLAIFEFDNDMDKLKPPMEAKDHQVEQLPKLKICLAWILPLKSGVTVAFNYLSCICHKI